MFGPRLDGQGGVSLVASTLDHFKLHIQWIVQPEVGRFWGPRFGALTEERQEERFKRTGEDETQIMWTIAYHDEPVGWTGIFDIDWVRRDGESGIVIGRHDLFGRGIASEAVRLRTGFAWREMRLHRVHNWIALANRGSRRANEKAGYKQMGLFRHSFFRSGEWYDEWLGEAYPHTFPEQD
jgi:RimJ/RimL family protein N-acetyltransferase